MSRLLPLWILILLFALPLLLGWFYFLNPQRLPDRQNNNGALIHPPRPVQQLRLYTENGAAFDWQQMAGLWLLVSVQQGRCDPACQRQLQQLRQIRLALGADRQRVKPLLILLDNNLHNNNRENAPPAERPADLQILHAEEAEQVSAFFGIHKGDSAGSRFIIDPSGAWMMRHDKTLEPKAVLQDLELLLKASQR